MHHYDSLMENPARETPRFLAMWKQISHHFSSYSYKLLFEPLNEPRDSLTSERWNTLQAQVIDTIRVENPKRCLIITPTSWANFSALSSMKIPDSSSNLIATFHYYDPHNFTHQGVTFEPNMNVYLGMTWRATASQRAQVDHDFNLVATWSKTSGIPVYLGEFGTNVKVDTTSRAMYTEYLVRECAKLGFSWTVWNFSSDFGIMNDSTNVWDHYLLQALLHTGNNAALDSALADTTAIDLSKYVAFADFEDTTAVGGRISTSGKTWAMAHNILLDSSMADWYVFISDSSTASTGNGTPLYPWQLEKTGSPRNFAKAIDPSGYNGHALHIKGTLRGDGYPFWGFGAGITGWDSAWHNVCSMTAIQFKAKGHGDLYVQLISDSVYYGYASPNNWGEFGAPFTLTDQWQDFTIPTAIFAPKPYSQQAIDGLVWKDVCNKVNAIEFQSGQSYGSTVNDSLDVWLDDVRLIGLDSTALQ